MFKKNLPLKIALDKKHKKINFITKNKNYILVNIIQ